MGSLLAKGHPLITLGVRGEGFEKKHESHKEEEAICNGISRIYFYAQFLNLKSNQETTCKRNICLVFCITMLNFSKCNQTFTKLISYKTSPHIANDE